MPRQDIRALMLEGGNIMKFEIEGLNSSQPAVYQGIWLDIGVIDHAFNILGIGLDHEIFDADYPDFDHLECLEETI